ncbi:ARM repeat-containing protein [Piedraia hortae CBS 480.64]|uniref:ARM repeat-containing protein n=1 Tax=Piedraia hortae CBS 480.64 TaxID=1314780 RepID=A0A6A7C827_9PEZI|nr:ARM repeat-containing protein [Piedraia hortae CBS 480.64]
MTSSEEREMQLLQKLEFNIASARSDEKFQSILDTYLAPLLLKAASESPNVRKKVVTMCQHISTRIKPQTIQLPVAKLMTQFNEKENSMIRNLDLMYIQQGVGRLSDQKKAELMPVVISSITKAGSHASQVFNLMLRLLESYKVPPRASKEDAELRAACGLSDEDAKHLADLLGKFILFTPQKAPGLQCCPGLTTEEYSFMMLEGKEGVWDPATGGLNLLRTKVLAAKILASGLFNDKERFLPALFAKADAASQISDVGEDMLKRALPAADLEDEALIEQLFEIYLGRDGVPKIRTALQIKILELLAKSTKGTSFTENVTKLIDSRISIQPSNPERVGPRLIYHDREGSKLQTVFFQYLQFVARVAPADTLHTISPRLIQNLHKSILAQGWPKPHPGEDLAHRGYCYELIGLIIGAAPREVLIGGNFGVLKWLLHSLAREESSSAVTISIEESLSAFMSALSKMEMEQEEQNLLETILVNEMTVSEDLSSHQRLRSTEYVAVRLANQCLSFSSAKARWVDVLGSRAVAGRQEVREAARQGLDPYWHLMQKGSTDLVFPSFSAVMAQFYPRQDPDYGQEPVELARQVRSEHPDCFPRMISFARQILVSEALSAANEAFKLDSDWQRRIDYALQDNDKARIAVKQYLQHHSIEEVNALPTLLSAMLIGITEGSLIPAGDYLIEFLPLASDADVLRLVPNLEQLVKTLLTNDPAKRRVAAQVYGVLASHPAKSHSEVRIDNSKLLDRVKAWDGEGSARSSQVHGAVLALGYFLSRCEYRDQGMMDEPLAQEYLATISAMLRSSQDASLLQACQVALGQLSIFGALTVVLISRYMNVREIFQKSYKMAKEGNHVTIVCLGQVSLMLPEDGDDLKFVEDELYKLHDVNQPEAHFAIGEAFSYLAAGWKSTALASNVDIDGPKPKGLERKSTLVSVTERILKDCANPKPSLRKAAVMWLLCLVQFCGQLPEIQQRLPRFQNAFKRCLSDRDSLVQESASRGLGLVYDQGDRKLKDDLVRDLMTSLSSDRQSQLAGNVSEETQLFEPGALPTEDGSVSTYKDIMNLASEVGDSSLVYRFMNMASSNAIWSSRAALGRFGLNNVLTDASVDKYLASHPKLYPKLFRYRFDPSRGVRSSMNSIWNSLIKDSAATIDTHFNEIMSDLLVSILGKEWRVRQASCAAIADLVQTQSSEKYENYLEPIWQKCFKVLDDIKDSVRTAAASLARTLTGVLTRTLETDHSNKRAAAMLGHVVPFLLSPSGMESTAEDVRAFAVHALLQIVKKANGEALRPVIPDIVERLIGSLSTLEPEAVNYLHLNASKYNLTEQQIDDRRLSYIRTSPHMEAVERCLDLLDAGTMEKLQPKLESAMVSAVGLPSKVASSRVLVTLSTRKIALFSPYADRFLKIIEKLVIDRNETVLSSYAVTAGYIARAASDSQILRLIEFCKRLYFESEGDRESATPKRAVASGDIIYSTAKHATDRFNAVATSVLPFVFIAKHDPNEHVQEQFQKTWEEAVGGPRAVSLYQIEIVRLATKHLDSPQWVLKHTSALAVADATTTLCSLGSGNLNGDHLWPALEKSLNGKTWPGKEAALQAFVRFVETAKPWYEPKKEICSAITKISLREASRQNATYRQHSIASLAQICRARSDENMFPQVYNLVEPILFLSEDPDEMEIDSDVLQQNTQAAAIEALLDSVPPSSGEDAEKAVSLLAKMTGHRSRKMWLKTFEALARLMERLEDVKNWVGNERVFEVLWNVLMTASPGTEALRLKWLETVRIWFELVPEKMKGRIRQGLGGMMKDEKSMSVKRGIERLVGM